MAAAKLRPKRSFYNRTDSMYINGNLVYYKSQLRYIDEDTKNKLLFSMNTEKFDNAYIIIKNFKKDYEDCTVTLNKTFFMHRPYIKGWWQTISATTPIKFKLFEKDFKDLEVKTEFAEIPGLFSTSSVADKLPVKDFAALVDDRKANRRKLQYYKPTKNTK